MATINANTVALYIDTAAGAFSTNPGETQSDSPALKPVMFSTSASISVSNATYDTQFKKATAATNSSVPGLSPTRGYGVGTTSTSLTVEGVASWDTLSNCVDLKTLFDEVVGKAQVTAVWASNDSNGTAYGGKGFVTSFEISSGVDDFATFSCSVELTGDPTAVA